MHAYRLLERKDWCQKAQARDVDGIPVDARDSDAVSFCMTGAVARAYKTDRGIRTRIYDALIQKLPIDPVAWNDRPDRTKEDVIETLKKIEISLDKPR